MAQGTKQLFLGQSDTSKNVTWQDTSNAGCRELDDSVDSDSGEGLSEEGDARGFVPQAPGSMTVSTIQMLHNPSLNNPVGHTVFYRWRHSGSEGLRNLPKFTQLKKMAALSLKPCSFYHTMVPY